MNTTVDPTISLCMIVKDEEKNLPTCLDSVKNLVNEMVVVDTGSTDRTIDIARRYNAKVFSITWRDDYSLARNESLKYATGDWILYLDADERIDAENKNKIRQLIRNTDIMAINTRVVIPQPKGNLVTDFSLDYCRIFRNLPQIQFEGRIHEQVLPSVLKLGGNVIKSDVTIDHWAFGLGQDKRKFRVQRNLKLLQTELEKNPNDPFLLYHLGVTYRTLGETDLAIDYFERIEKNKLKHELMSNVYIFLAQLYILKNNYDQANKNSLLAIELTPKETLPYYILATINFEEGKL